MITLVLIKIGVFNFYYINMVELFFFLLTLILIYCSNILNKLPISASNLYAKNMFNFVNNLFNKDKKTFDINLEDEIIQKTMFK